MSDEHGPGTGPDDDAGRATGEDVGSVGDEAAKLLGALSEWARDSTGLSGLSGLGDDARGGPGLGESLSGLADHAAATVSEISSHIATGSAECTYCPICRTVHAVRQTSPEVKAHLAGAASSFLQAMVGLLATLPPPTGGGAGQTGGPGVERIDLDDDEDEDT